MKQHDPEERAGQNVEKGEYCSPSTIPLSKARRPSSPSVSVHPKYVTKINHQTLNLPLESAQACAQAHIYFLSHKPLEITTLL